MSPTNQFTQSKKQVVIESVVPLTQTQLQTIGKALKLDDDKLELTNRPNPLLLAGLRIIFQGQMIDLSFKNMLNQLGEAGHV